MLTTAYDNSRIYGRINLNPNLKTLDITLFRSWKGVNKFDIRKDNDANKNDNLII